MNNDIKINMENLNTLRPTPSRNPWLELVWRLRNNKIAIAGFVVFFILCISCVIAPVLTDYSYSAINIDRILEMPSRDHVLGTDNLGRDLLTRLLYGGRMTLRIALISTSLAAVVGAVIGLVSGYFGGKADLAIAPVLDIIASVPVILLAIIFETILGRGRGYFLYAIAIASIPQFARLVRASVMNVMGREYIEAARALGVSNVGIILKHVFHNIAPALIVRFTSGFSEALLTCTVMGYMNISVNPPTPEWGVIVFNSKLIFRSHPRIMIISCSVIALCVISISLFGDGLRDALDPAG